MDDRDLARMPLQDHFTATAARTALQMHHLRKSGRASAGGPQRTTRIEPRTRSATSQTELVLVPSDATEALWLTHMGD